MASWWGTYSYFNYELIQIGDIVLMNDAFVSSVSCVSRVI